jgi:hypothetical protein
VWVSRSEDAQRAADHLAVEVGDDHVPGAELVVVDARGLDDDQTLLPVDAGSVAEGVEDQAAADEFEVGFQDFFAKALQVHRVTPRKRVNDFSGDSDPGLLRRPSS